MEVERANSRVNPVYEFSFTPLEASGRKVFNLKGVFLRRWRQVRWLTWFHSVWFSGGLLFVHYHRLEATSFSSVVFSGLQAPERL